MGKSAKEKNISDLANKHSSKFDYSKQETAIILAAGHGKRIKSNTSKMLHEIWGIPTVERVYNACRNGMRNSNIITVVGIKAGEVIQTLGKRKNALFAHQAEQKGTGHAVQCALEKISKKKFKGIIFIFPGDMGLIDAETIKQFKKNFQKSDADMMVLTGLYEGNPAENSYGRIIRVKERDVKGISSGQDFRKVIEIKEHKDILNLKDDEEYVVSYKGREYGYSKNELIENNEFNSGVFAFKFSHLSKLIHKIKSNNVQKEIYITDLISLFNQNNLAVEAVSPKEQYVIMGFNNKSVLKEMNAIARRHVYEKIKDIVEIEDPDDFFIHQNVVENILKLDKKGKPVDIKIGKGVRIGKGVKLNYHLNINKNAVVSGNIVFGKDIAVSDNAEITCQAGQKIQLDDGVKILRGNILKGNIQIGKNTIIESRVNITGSNDYKARIGKNVVIKGSSYIFGSRIDDNVLVEHSVLKNKKIINNKKMKEKRIEVKYYLPEVEGEENIKNLK